MKGRARCLVVCVGLSVSGCLSTPSLPTTPSESAAIEGYLSAQPGLRLYSDQDSRDGRSNQDCIQLLRPEPTQAQPILNGRVRVTGRLGVFDDIFKLAKLQIGTDHATHELCEARYLIVRDITDLSRD